MTLRQPRGCGGGCDGQPQLSLRWACCLASAQVSGLAWACGRGWWVASSGRRSLHVHAPCLRLRMMSGMQRRRGLPALPSGGCGGSSGGVSCPGSSTAQCTASCMARCMWVPCCATSASCPSSGRAAQTLPAEVSWRPFPMLSCCAPLSPLPPSGCAGCLGLWLAVRPRLPVPGCCWQMTTWSGSPLTWIRYGWPCGRRTCMLCGSCGAGAP